MEIPERFKGFYLQNKLNALKAKKIKIKEEEFYIRSFVECAICKKKYIPFDLLGLAKNQVSPILANNWCSSKCYNNSESLEKI